MKIRKNRILEFYLVLALRFFFQSRIFGGGVYLPPLISSLPVLFFYGAWELCGSWTFVAPDRDAKHVSEVHLKLDLHSESPLDFSEFFQPDPQTGYVCISGPGPFPILFSV